MKYLLSIFVIFICSFSTMATENPFDEQSFESVTKSDTEKLRSEIEMLKSELGFIRTQREQSKEGSDAPESLNAKPIMVINGHYFVRPSTGGLPKRVSATAFQKISGEGQ